MLFCTYIHSEGRLSLHVIRIIGFIAIPYFFQVFFFFKFYALTIDLLTNLPRISGLQCSTTEPQRLFGERGPLRSSCMIRVLHTARINDVDSVKVCATFLLPDFNSSFTALKKQNILNPHEFIMLQRR